MNKQEAQVIRKLVKQALAAGYTVSVYDGEEWALKLSTQPEKIMAELGATDCEVLRFRKDGRQVASVTLIYGNSPAEVIADYSAGDLDAFSEWLAPINAYAEGVH